MSSFVTFVRHFFSTVYSLLFLVGTAGNLWVLTLVGCVFYAHRHRPLAYRNVYVYVFVLCLCNLLNLSMLPALISDVWLGGWVFGRAICKLSWVVESVNKLFAIGVLTAIGLDRYLTVSRSTLHRHLCSARAQMLLLLVMLLLTTLLLQPVLWYADVLKIGNDTFKCTANHMPHAIHHAFTWYIFVLGYCLPALLFAFSYIRLYRLSTAPSGQSCNARSEIHHSFGDAAECTSTSSASALGRPTRLRRERARRVTRAIWSTVAFHMVCWTPYWLFVLAPSVVRVDAFGRRFVVAAMFVHTLPHVNAAGNWLFYALLNRHLRDAGAQSTARVRTLLRSTLSRSCERLQLNSPAATLRRRSASFAAPARPKRVVELSFRTQCRSADDRKYSLTYL